MKPKESIRVTMRQAETNLITSIINTTHPCEHMEHYMHIILVLYNRCQAEETAQKKWMVSHVNIPVMCKNLEVMDMKKIAGDDTPTQTNTHTCTYCVDQKIFTNKKFSPILVHVWNTLLKAS